jgi:hypothetical protein
MEEYPDSIKEATMKRLLLPAAVFWASAAAYAGSCLPDEHTLCLNGSRFAVETAFQLGPGLGPLILSNAVPLTNQSGYFWFFDSSNVEVVIKVLDGCAINDHFWVFVAGLTNVGVSITVSDAILLLRIDLNSHDSSRLRRIIGFSRRRLEIVLQDSVDDDGHRDPGLFLQQV